MSNAPAGLFGFTVGTGMFWFWCYHPVGLRKVIHATYRTPRS